MQGKQSVAPVYAAIALAPGRNGESVIPFRLWGETPRTVSLEDLQWRNATVELAVEHNI